MRRGRQRVYAAGAGALAVAALLAACGKIAPDAALRGDAGGASDAASSAFDAARDSARPPRGPFKGWEIFDEYAGCNLQIPGTPADLPPALRWGPCPQTPQTAGLDCRELVLDWKPRASEWVAAWRAIRRTDGTVALMLTRFEEVETYAVVAAVDGPVAVAIKENDPHCALSSGESDGDHYFWDVTHIGLSDPNDHHPGAIGGSLDDLLPRVIHQQADIESVRAVGEPGIVSTEGLLSWSVGAPSMVSAHGDPHFSGKALLWWSGPPGGELGVWTAATGASVLRSATNDLSRGLSSFDSDGKDMVWVEASRPMATPNNGDIFSLAQMVTSPHATSSAGVHSRVLRSDLSGYGLAARMVVGCGYAARSAFVNDPDGGEPRGGTLVVRIADGSAWLLPSAPALPFAWLEVLAITCDEVFVAVNEQFGDGGYRWNVARVRLDSLGLPTPP